MSMGSNSKHDVEAALSLAKFERWRQCLHLPLSGPSGLGLVSKVRGEAAKRKAAAHEQERLAALEGARRDIRERVERREQIPEGLADIALNLGLRLLASASPEEAIADLRLILGPSSRKGAKVDPQSVKVAMAVASKISRGSGVGEAIIATAGETGVSEKQVERDYRNHRRRAIAENANADMEVDNAEYRRALDAALDKGHPR
jgi:hypothetical protein